MALRTTITYEDPTVGGYLRRTARTLPAGRTTTTTHYGDTEAPVQATCNLSSTTPQGGLVKQVTHPDPDGTGGQQPVVEQFVYDAAGRTVGTRKAAANTIATAPWACITYDGRGRVTTQTWPAHNGAPARRVVTDYAVANDPLITAVAEPSAPFGGPPITTVLDLRGRLVTYGTAQREYDPLGRETVVRDNGFWTRNSYDPATGRLSSTEVNDGGFGGAPPAPRHIITATPTYDPATGRITQVAYSNGTTTAFGVDANGRPNAITHTGPGSTPVAIDWVTRSPAGRLTEQITLDATGGVVDANPAGPNYLYDAAGRLTDSWGTAGQEQYRYGTATCGEANAGRNTNLTSIVRGGQTETYCYNRADRLTSGTGITSVAYDDHGNTTTLGTQTYLWDAADRHIGIRAGSTTIDYVRDPLDRMFERRSGSSTVRYRYTGYGDSPTATSNAAGTIIERYASLPGGVTVTFSATSSSETWAHPNLHGDIVATTTQTGTRQGNPRTYGPYGTGTAPDTTTGPRDQGYLGNTIRYTDQTPGIEPIIDMGARPYLPRLGRFLTTDPIEGGCANNYVYTYGDPINSADTSGMAENDACGGTFYLNVDDNGNFTFGFEGLDVLAIGVAYFWLVGGLEDQQTGTGAATLWFRRDWEKSIDKQPGSGSGVSNPLVVVASMVVVAVKEGSIFESATIVECHSGILRENLF